MSVWFSSSLGYPTQDISQDISWVSFFLSFFLSFYAKPIKIFRVKSILQPSTFTVGIMKSDNQLSKPEKFSPLPILKCGFLFSKRIIKI